MARLAPHTNQKPSSPLSHITVRPRPANTSSKPKKPTAKAIRTKPQIPKKGPTRGQKATTRAHDVYDHEHATHGANPEYVSHRESRRQSTGRNHQGRNHDDGAPERPSTQARPRSSEHRHRPRQEINSPERGAPDSRRREHISSSRRSHNRSRSRNREHEVRNVNRGERTRSRERHHRDNEIRLETGRSKDVRQNENRSRSRARGRELEQVDTRREEGRGTAHGRSNYMDHEARGRSRRRRSLSAQRTTAGRDDDRRRRSASMTRGRTQRRRSRSRTQEGRDRYKNQDNRGGDRRVDGYGEGHRTSNHDPHRQHHSHSGSKSHHDTRDEPPRNKDSRRRPHSRRPPSPIRLGMPPLDQYPPDLRPYAPELDVDMDWDDEIEVRRYKEMERTMRKKFGSSTFLREAPPRLDVGVNVEIPRRFRGRGTNRDMVRVMKVDTWEDAKQRKREIRSIFRYKYRYLFVKSWKNMSESVRARVMYAFALEFGHWRWEQWQIKRVIMSLGEDGQRNSREKARLKDKASAKVLKDLQMAGALNRNVDIPPLGGVGGYSANRHGSREDTDPPGYRSRPHDHDHHRQRDHVDRDGRVRKPGASRHRNDGASGHGRGSGHGQSRLDQPATHYRHRTGDHRPFKSPDLGKDRELTGGNTRRRSRSASVQRSRHGFFAARERSVDSYRPEHDPRAHSHGHSSFPWQLQGRDPYDDEPMRSRGRSCTPRSVRLSSPRRPTMSPYADPEPVPAPYDTLTYDKSHIYHSGRMSSHHRLTTTPEPNSHLQSLYDRVQALYGHHRPEIRHAIYDGQDDRNRDHERNPRDADDLGRSRDGHGTVRGEDVQINMPVVYRGRDFYGGSSRERMNYDHHGNDREVESHMSDRERARHGAERDRHSSPSGSRPGLSASSPTYRQRSLEATHRHYYEDSDRVPGRQSTPPTPVAVRAQRSTSMTSYYDYASMRASPVMPNTSPYAYDGSRSRSTSSGARNYMDDETYRSPTHSRVVTPPPPVLGSPSPTSAKGYSSPTRPRSLSRSRSVSRATLSESRPLAHSPTLRSPGRSMPKYARSTSNSYRSTRSMSRTPSTRSAAQTVTYGPVFRARSISRSVSPLNAARSRSGGHGPARNARSPSRSSVISQFRPRANSRPVASRDSISASSRSKEAVGSSRGKMALSGPSPPYTGNPLGARAASPRVSRSRSRARGHSRSSGGSRLHSTSRPHGYTNTSRAHSRSTSRGYSRSQVPRMSRLRSISRPRTDVRQSQQHAKARASLSRSRSRSPVAASSRASKYHVHVGDHLSRPAPPIASTTRSAIGAGDRDKFQVAGSISDRAGERRRGSYGPRGRSITRSPPPPAPPPHQDTALGKSLANYYEKALIRRPRLQEGRRRLMTTPPADTAEGREFRRISSRLDGGQHPAVDPTRKWSRDARRGHEETEELPEHPKPKKARMSTVADKQAKKLGISFPSSMKSMPTSELNEWVPPASTTTRGRVTRIAQDALYYQREREVLKRRSSRRDIVQQQRKVTREVATNASAQLHGARERTDTWDGRMNAPPLEHWKANGYEPLQRWV